LEHLNKRETETEFGPTNFKYIQLTHLVEILPNIHDPTYFLGDNPGASGPPTMHQIITSIVPFPETFNKRDSIEHTRRRRSSNQNLQITIPDFNVGGTAQPLKLIVSQTKCLVSECGLPAYYTCVDKKCTYDSCGQDATWYRIIPNKGLKFMCVRHKDERMSKSDHVENNIELQENYPFFCILHRNVNSQSYLFDAEDDYDNFSKIECECQCTSSATIHIHRYIIPLVCKDHHKYKHSFSTLLKKHYDEAIETLDYESFQDHENPLSVDQEMANWVYLSKMEESDEEEDEDEDDSGIDNDDELSSDGSFEPDTESESDDSSSHENNDLPYFIEFA
jgi:hypothetical protein